MMQTHYPKTKTTRRNEKKFNQFHSQLQSARKFERPWFAGRASAQGYPDVEHLATALMMAVNVLQTPFAIGSLIAAYGACACAIRYEAPLLHLTRELGEAFLKTAVPEDLSDLRFPFPAWIINLPLGMLQSDQGEEVLAIVVADPDGVAAALPKLFPEKPFVLQTRPENSGWVVISALLSTGEIEYIFIGKPEVIEAANGGDIDFGPDAADFFGQVSDSRIHPQLARIVLNAMLCLQNMPELDTEEEVTARRHKGFGRNSTYKGSIRWLGRDYRRRQSGGAGETGTGGTKSPHWRRGHWHTVLHGAGRLMRRMKWFEPVYVNGLSGQEVKR